MNKKTLLLAITLFVASSASTAMERKNYIYRLENQLNNKTIAQVYEKIGRQNMEHIEKLDISSTKEVPIETNVFQVMNLLKKFPNLKQIRISGKLPYETVLWISTLTKKTHQHPITLLDKE